MMTSFQMRLMVQSQVSKEDLRDSVNQLEMNIMKMTMGPSSGMI
jgi:hypothetical protein